MPLDFHLSIFQRTSSAKETIQGKWLFGQCVASFGHKTNKTLPWCLLPKCGRPIHCISNHQGLSFTAVGGHHQNGVAENEIRQLQSQARTMLTHAAKRWPQAVTACPGPHAICMAAALIEDEPEDEGVDPSFQVTAPKATSFDLDGPNTPGPNTPCINH